MVTDAAVTDEAAVSDEIAPPWWMGVFEKMLSGYSTPLATERSAVTTNPVPSIEPAPRLAWFPAVMENLSRLPWGSGAWSSEGAKPLSDSAVTALLLLLRDFLPPDGPAPVISPTWDGGVQADWELGDLYLELEIVPNGVTRCCFVDERCGETVEEEFELDGHEETLQAHVAVIMTAVSGTR